jgi:hypothetical protein
MTKYKTDAEKLKFFREAREARQLPKATIGMITNKPGILVEDDTIVPQQPVQRDNTFVPPDPRLLDIKRKMDLIKLIQTAGGGKSSSKKQARKNK